MRLSQREHAAIIAGLERIDEERQRILDVLLPDPADDDEPIEAGCVHPGDAIANESTLGDERFVCTACGAAFQSDPRTLNPEE